MTVCGENPELGKAVAAYYASKSESLEQCLAKARPDNSDDRVKCRLGQAFLASRLETIRIGPDVFYPLEPQVCAALGGEDAIRKKYGVCVQCK